MTRNYVAIYRRKRIQVQAESIYEAQKKAAAEFGAKKSHQVSVFLSDVVHDPAVLPGS